MKIEIMSTHNMYYAVFKIFNTPILYFFILSFTVIYAKLAEAACTTTGSNVTCDGSLPPNPDSYNNAALTNLVQIYVQSGASVSSFANEGDVSNANNLGAVLNDGTISTLDNNGTINGIAPNTDANGIYNSNFIGVINNSGSIYGTRTIGFYGSGIYNGGGSITTINNTGTISVTDESAIKKYW